MPTPKKRRVKYWWNEFFSASFGPYPGTEEPVSPTPQADLNLTIVASPTSGEASTPIVFTVSLGNNGSDNAIDAKVDFTFNDLVFSSAGTPSVGSFAGTTWTVGDLSSGGSAATLELTMTIPASGGDTASLALDGTASSTTQDPDTLNNTTTSTVTYVATGDISGTATATPTSFPDDTATAVEYEYTWTNQGPDMVVGPLTSPTVTFPAGLTYDSVAFSGDLAGSFADNALSFAGNLAVGGSVTATFSFTTISPSTDPTALAISLTSATTTDPVPGNNTATAEAIRTTV